MLGHGQFRGKLLDEAKWHRDNAGSSDRSEQFEEGFVAGIQYAILLLAIFTGEAPRWDGKCDDQPPPDKKKAISVADILSATTVLSVEQT